MAGTVTVDAIRSEAATPTVFRNSSNVEIGQLTRSWFTCTVGSPPTVRASFNISSMTYVSGGQTYHNYSTSFADTNYSVTLGHNYQTNGAGDSGISPQVSSYTATPITASLTYIAYLYQGTGYNCASGYVHINR